MLKVLLLSDFTSAFSRLLLQGFLEYSKERGDWHFYRIPLNRDDFGDEAKMRVVMKVARQWKANAIIGQIPTLGLEGLRSLGIPIVLQNYSRRVEGMSNITGDYYGTGELAANYFLRKGFKSFAFYGTGDTVWSREREDGFRSRLAEFGETVSAYNEPVNIQFGSTIEHQELLDWLCSLPSGTALFACDDLFALRVTEACELCNIRIPDDLAVLGVDNDEILCNMSDPPLSSIVLDVKNGGYRAASQLDRMVHNPDEPQFNIVINPIRIERRKSTEGFSVSDPLVKNALNMIEHSEGQLLNISEIIDRLCTSRRVLEKHFRKEVGTTIYQYMLDYRASCFAEKILASDRAIMEIAYDLGYDDYVTLSKSFKKIYNMTPTQYRNYYKLGKTIINNK